MPPDQDKLALPFLTGKSFLPHTCPPTPLRFGDASQWRAVPGKDTTLAPHCVCCSAGEVTKEKSPENHALFSLCARDVLTALAPVQCRV
jgi:hypothetical protein